jgi:hydroxylaminobenzene mutase
MLHGALLLQLAIIGELLVVPHVGATLAPSAYFSALMFGPLLALIGLLWGEVALPTALRRTIRALLPGSAYAVVAAILLSAVYRLDRFVNLGYVLLLPSGLILTWALGSRPGKHSRAIDERRKCGMDGRIRSRLIVHGMTLFVLGLTTKLIMYLLVNPRMAIASHLVALMAGLFLLLVGVLWDSMDLPRRVQGPASVLFLFSTYTAWGSMFVSALFGCSRSTPFASSGVFGAAQWQENVTDTIYVAFFISIVLSGFVMLWGLWRRVLTAKVE